MKKEFLAIGTLVGTIVGVGIFGLPYAFVRSGFWVGVGYLVVFTAVMTLLHLLYGETILRTEKEMRFFGYARWYLGPWSEIPTTISTMTAVFGAMLAYLLMGGRFLSSLFEGSFGGSERAYLFLFWAIFTAVVVFGLRAVARAELAMTIGLIGAIIFIFVASLFYFKNANLGALVGPRDIFLPYGIVLFALSGGLVIPEIRDVLRGEEQSMKKVIIAGTVTSAVLYLLFAVAVVGVSGVATTDDAIGGLSAVIGKNIAVLGAIFGLLAVATSFIATGIYFRDLLMYDVGFSKWQALSVVVFFPPLLLLFGIANYISIIGFIGAVAGGIDAILIILMHRRARLVGHRNPEYSLKIPAFAVRLLLLCFMVGIIYEIVLQLKG